MDITAARIAAAKATHAQSIMQAEYTLAAELHNIGAITDAERNERVETAHRVYCDTVKSLAPVTTIDGATYGPDDDDQPED